LLIPIISGGSRTAADILSVAVLEPLLITLDYQQRQICSGAKIITDDSYEPLQMIFSIVVCEIIYFAWSTK
jgi:hypothetical protein